MNNPQLYNVHRLSAEQDSLLTEPHAEQSNWAHCAGKDAGCALIGNGR
jgi:hypothetical protein